MNERQVPMAGSGTRNDRNVGGCGQLPLTIDERQHCKVDPKALFPDTTISSHWAVVDSSPIADSDRPCKGSAWT
jgi:hypothetical protein